MLDLKKIIFFGTLLILWVGCSDDSPELQITGPIPLEIFAQVNPRTKTNLAGDQFGKNDSFVLYKGMATSDNTEFSKYSYTDDGKWTGEPGLFWDDMDLNTPIFFTAILPNNDNLSLITAAPHIFTVNTEQNPTDTLDFIKNDLLVAYGEAQYIGNANDKILKLTFQHELARLILKVKDETIDGEGPVILDANTDVYLNEVQVESQVTFLTTKPANNTVRTGVIAQGNKKPITMRKASNTNPFIYEAILPAQSLATGVTITFKNNTNGQEYTYDLSSQDNIKKEGTSDIVAPGDLLKQGQSTTLSLKIKKRGISITASIKPWVEKSASATATPDDYPIIEIGGGKGTGEGDGGLIEGDDYAGKTIRLTGDIDANDTNLKFPIGSKDKPFRGTFEGQGYKIYNINLDMDTAFLGVFGYTDGATIRDLNIVESTFHNKNTSSNTATGALAGYINNTTIENCHVLNVNVSADYDNVGGLIGYVNGTSSTITKSSATATVRSMHDYGGGLIGRAEKGMTLSYSYATGNTTINGLYVGGLIGYANNVKIDFCYTWGSALGNRYAGGLIGKTNGDANGASMSVRNCYAAGAQVSATTQAGFIGSAVNTIVKNSYWNVALSNGLGCSDATFDGTNSSFTLRTNEDAMQTVKNGLNKRDGEGDKDEWDLVSGYDTYVLPVLLQNKPN